MRALKTCFLVIFFLLSNVLTASANSSNTLITADLTSYEWVESEVLIFNTHQKKIAGGKLYENMSADELSILSRHYCDYSERVIEKIERIDMNGETKWQQTFKRGLAHLENYKCSNADEIFSARDLNKRHTEFLRALAYISMGRYVEN